MATQRLMKEGVGEAAVIRIGAALLEVIPSFPIDDFIGESNDGLEALELKERVMHLIHVLHRYLPVDFLEAASCLERIPAVWDHGDVDDALSGFAAWPLIDYVAVYGLESPEVSLELLRKLTPLFSAEFALQPFLIHHQDLTLKTLKVWSTDVDSHVRRLVSEGTRPRLPWGKRLTAFVDDPTSCLLLLEALKDDPSEYVRRSVANHLNDISKDHADLVIERCYQWQEGASTDRQWIIKHATRSLVKLGHPMVFGLLGYTTDPEIELLSFSIDSSTVQFGEALTWKAELKSKSSQAQKLVIDYVIHHQKANGMMSPKVFKYKSSNLDGTSTITLSKKHAIKPITTRTYYPGEHAVEILVNGRSLGRVTFVLNIVS